MSFDPEFSERHWRAPSEPPHDRPPFPLAGGGPNWKTVAIEITAVTCLVAAVWGVWTLSRFAAEVLATVGVLIGAYAIGCAVAARVPQLLEKFQPVVKWGSAAASATVVMILLSYFI